MWVAGAGPKIPHIVERPEEKKKSGMGTRQKTAAAFGQLIDLLLPSSVELFPVSAMPLPVQANSGVPGGHGGYPRL
jgi:hypothetical protein